MAAGASLEPQRRVRFGWVGPGGEGLQPGGAGGGGRGAAGGPCQAHRFPPFRRGALPCPLLPHPGPQPTSQARPLPDVGAAQGEPQQVERSAAHAQADEADHRDELREDRGHCPSVPSPQLPSPFTRFPAGRPPPRLGACSLPSGSGDLAPRAPQLRPRLPHPTAGLSRGVQGRSEGHIAGIVEDTLEKVRALGGGGG